MNNLVAYLPGQSSLEMTMTSGQFNEELFLMANAVEKFEATDEYEAYITQRVPVQKIGDAPAQGQTDERPYGVILKHEPITNSVYIAGLTATVNDSFKTSENYTVENVGKQQEPQWAVKFIAYDQSTEKGVKDLDTLTEIEVSYKYLSPASVIQVDNRSTAVGEAIFKWPVYASGDDCTQSAIKGYVVMRVYRCRVTAMPGFDTSYKNAATNAVTFSAMDPKRDDEKVYSLAFVPETKE